MVNNLFLFVAFVTMWVMIFGVALFYFGLVARKNRLHTLFFTTVSLLITIVVWLFAGYTLAFSGDHWLLGDFTFNLGHLPLVLADLAQPDELFSCVFQLAFCLYAVIMLNGAVVERINWRFFSLFLPLWLLTVYVPLARWLWHDTGWLSELGVLDFSGALVVHLSAGVSSLVLAKVLGPRKKSNLPSQPDNLLLLFLATVFICFGWFGFNAGPVGEINQLTGLIIINTLLAIVGGAFGWLLCDLITRKKPSLLGLLNGMIVGLVSSTSGVAYVTPLGMLAICCLAGSGCHLSIRWLTKRWSVDDPVDTFGMNAVGGIIGALGTGLFASLAVNKSGQNGVLYGDFQLLVSQISGIIVGIGLSVVMTYISAKFIGLFLPMRTTADEELVGLDQSILNERSSD